MTSDEVVKTKVDLLKTELTLSDSKMRSIVDRLWQIRALCGTIWSALVAIGLGAGTGDRKPLPELLWLSAFVPIWFAWIDSSYQRWYRTFRMREEAIGEFFNGSSTGSRKWGRFEEAANTNEFNFPVLDMYGRLTYGEDPAYLWRTSRWPNLFDTTPVLTFGGLFVGSLILCFLRPGPLPRWSAIAIGLMVISCAYGAGYWRRSRIRSVAPNTAAPADQKASLPGR